MALVPEAPRGIVEVAGDADAVVADVHAITDAVPDRRGITAVADAVVRGLAGGTATLLVRAPEGLRYAAIVVRDGIAQWVVLRRRDDGFAAHLNVAPGEVLHLTVVAGTDEAAMRELEDEVAGGGMGMGGGPDVMAEPPLAESAPPPPPAPAAPPPPPAMPEPAPDAEPSGGTAGALDGATPVPAFVDAEVPSAVVEGVVFEAVVRLSVSDLTPTKGTSRKKAVARFDPTREIEVGVQLRGFAPADGTPAAVTTTLPAPGEEPRRLVFRLIGEEPGRGHITVTFTQPPVVTPLAVLAVSAAIRPADEELQPQEPDLRLVAASVAVPPREIADLPTIAVDETISRGRSDLVITAKIGRTVKRHVVRLDDKAAYVEGVYAELARIRREFVAEAEDDPDEAAETVRREVRSLGARIAGELLGDEINELLWRRRRRLSQVVLQTSGELDIPWEIVHLVPVGKQRPDPDRYFLGDLGLMRWMYGTPRPTVVPVDATRVLAIAPEYVNPDYRLPRAGEEVAALATLLAAAPRSAADPAQLREQIASGFDLLHFAGHGRWRDAAPPGQEIAFATWSEEDDGSAAYTDSDARRDLPELEDAAAAASAPFVFLSACDVGRLRSGATGLGGFAEAFLRGGVGVFIGCSWAVRDDVTAAFVRTFYEQTLGEHATLGDAVLAARRAAREAGDLTSLAFTVFADPRARLEPR
ncbi:CHAT domain-containing protein [Microbacterium atlanticum]|uniref:CHAT domain-containing protein n=1 Tax=Microbacterium atlanticum TaxID=2782168 RepID=UPI00188802B0|nr:CHAT domain-containing protein [Microbacterium atlanticum]